MDSYCERGQRNRDHFETGKTNTEHLKTRWCNIYVVMLSSVLLLKPLKLQAIKRTGKDNSVLACFYVVFLKGVWFHTPLFKLLWFVIYDFTFCQVYSGSVTCYFYVWINHRFVPVTLGSKFWDFIWGVSNQCLDASCTSPHTLSACLCLLLLIHSGTSWNVVFLFIPFMLTL